MGLCRDKFEFLYEYLSKRFTSVNSQFDLRVKVIYS